MVVFSKTSLLQHRCLAQANFAVLGKWPTCAGSNKLSNFKLQIFAVRWKLTKQGSQATPFGKGMQLISGSPYAET